VATVATTGDGVPELWEAINAHRAHAEASGQLESRRAFRAREELREIVAERLHQRARQICTGDRWEALTEAVAARESDPWAAADTMLDGVLDA
jgi:LAO/AO transport system kinase